MSDVSQPSAPSPSTPSAPPSAPMQTEVPVNEAPVHQPSPLGDQAPPKPPGQEINKSSRLGRRESIQKAFDRAKQGQEEAAKTQPQRRAQPPAAKEGDRAPAAERPQPHREQGRFARDPNRLEQAPNRQISDENKNVGQQPGQQQRPQAPQPLAPDARYRDAPQRFSDQARVEWAAAPESVRGAVHQMAREFQGAYEKYRGDHETMETIRPYHDLAQKQGTNIGTVLQNYATMEQKLRQDFIGGLDVLTNNMGMKHPDGSPVTLHDVAYHILNMTPEQHRMNSTQNRMTSADARIGQLHQTVEQLTNALGQMQYQQRFTHTRGEVDRFAETHPRFDALADLIKAELDHGYTLDVAYRRAELLRPSTQAAQTRTQSAQTRKTSISGAPDNPGNTRPSDGRQRTNGEAKHPSRREAIAKAMRRVGNGV
jgi:hypothetical protein